MERTKKPITKVAVVSMMLSAIIFFGSCQKNGNDPMRVQDSTALTTNSATGALATTATGTTYTVNLAGLRNDGGHAYKIAYPLSKSGDSNEEPTVSTLRLFENGVELKPPHSVHQDIRDSGKGRFSHWGTGLVFSASDNSNPSNNGRKYTYTLDGSAGGSTTTPAAPTAPTAPAGTTPTSTAGLMGYAMVNGTTTGGAGGSSVTVTTLAALKAAVGDNTKRIVYVSGTITGSGDEPVYVLSNKSIIGKPGAVIQGVSLYIFTVSNIIIQDIRFKNYVTDAAVMIKEQTHHVWVDHCEFSTDRNHGWDYWGKDISITRAADYVTVSWNKFHDTNLSVLISGGIAGHESDIGHLHVTLHHNFWYNVSEREPDMNYGSVHVFNNYHLNNTGYSLGARAGGNVRTDNEYFSNCAKPISTNLAGDPPGYFSGVNTNIYSNCGKNDITTAISNWLPGYSYTSVLDPAANVPALVQAGSGPRSIN
jgi:pectate lyase